MPKLCTSIDAEPHNGICYWFTSVLQTMNLCFAIYYTIEKILLIWANGWRRFANSKLDLFDAFILAVVVVRNGILYVSSKPQSCMLYICWDLDKALEQSSSIPWDIIGFWAYYSQSGFRVYEDIIASFSNARYWSWPVVDLGRKLQTNIFDDGIMIYLCHWFG